VRVQAERLAVLVEQPRRRRRQAEVVAEPFQHPRHVAREVAPPPGRLALQERHQVPRHPERLHELLCGRKLLQRRWLARCHV
jgi:hypothetical protein